MSAALADAARRQRQASDPQSSAWVSANAGSGKTHVLAQRVIRLLLAGAEPSKLLCLTFTKAAAANMAERVFERLAKWTRADDTTLAADIVEVGAAGADLDAARKLFARVIETPGGLKIQTLHAFCERVLHLFPFEANVPASFRPLDEREAALIREQAQARLFADADPELAEIIARVATLVGADDFATLVAETARLGAALTVHGSPAAFAAKLAERLGLAPGEDEATIAQDMLGQGPAVWRQWARALSQGTTADKKTAATLSGAAAITDKRLDVYLLAFFTQELTPRKSMATKATTERFPDIVDALYAERDRLFALLDKRRSAKAVARSRDLFALSQACERAYKRAKAARAALDFEDLISKTETLFERTDAAWVLYKLDRGVEHILVDEAQDTSRAQWSILAKLAEDFLSGEGAGPPARTFFAVGDEKQSIFSFQGAAPHLFDAMRRHFASRHERAKRSFLAVRLSHSFRSAPAVLEAVDKVFAVPEVWRGVSAGEPTAEPHFPIRENLPGLVELWPTLRADPLPDPGKWTDSVDAQKRTHGANALADRIAGVIARWTAPNSSESVADGATGALRPIRPGDILILVRSRGPLFEAMTRALRRARVPAAGADRLVLGRHIAALDLCAAARAALNPDDDLALAAALKSPLIGLDDEALMRLAPGRKGSLAEALAASDFQEAHAKLETWRARAASTPFDFFAKLLGADGGRRAMIRRLGSEAGDAIDEFLARALAHERDEAPSLPNFLAEIEAAGVEIKRDMEGASAEVRVMTVHAAKGLEAPIVFMPDTASAPGGRHDPKWLKLDPAHSGEAPLYVWASAGGDSAEIGAARATAREAAAGEYRRLLYVGMTRAAQRLVLASFAGARDPPTDCWAQLVGMGLVPAMREVPSWWDAAEPMLRLGEPPGAPAPQTLSAAPAIAPPPAWIAAPAQRELVFAPVAPSRRVAGEVTPQRLARLEEGRLAHRLLQSLPALSPERRRGAAEAFVARRGGLLDDERRAKLVARALALIEAPALAALFGPGSRAEVPFAASLARANGERVEINGRIDRLGIVENEVWVADFKTGPASVRREYRRQLALYGAAVGTMFPEAQIRAVLLWIDSGTFQELDASTLLEAYDDWAGEAASPS